MSVAFKAIELDSIQYLSDAEFEAIRSYFNEVSGNKLGPEKKSLVEGRLRRRLVATQLNIKDYLKFIKKNPAELSEFISCLTTHKTDWFRENLHFEFLKKQLSERNKKGIQDEFLVWSAACSTGEEVYSLAMTIAESNIEKFRILGTDISDNCLQTAEKGIYEKDKVHQQIPVHLKNKYFLKSNNKNFSDVFKFDPSFSNRIKWRKFNLMNSELHSNVKFDFIILRNVLIYFEPDDCHHIVTRLIRYLKPGGFFIVGLSETVNKHEKLGLKRVENSVYLKL